MSDLYWLTDEQMTRFAPFLPKGHGRLWVDNRRVLSGIIFVSHNSLRWRDVLAKYGLSNSLHNRWRCWSGMGVFARMTEGLAAEADTTRTVVTDAITFKAHRTAPSLPSKRGPGTQ